MLEWGPSRRFSSPSAPPIEYNPPGPCSGRRAAGGETVSQPESDRLRPFLAGIKDCLPVLPGVMSFGLICGAAMVAGGLSKAAAVAMTLFVFAGTMQLAAVQLAATGAPLVVIALAGAIINLRFAMFSLSIAPHFQGLPARVRALFAYALSDNGYAQSITHFTLHPDEPGHIPYHSGVTFAIWSAWTLPAIAGVFLGAAFPREWQLEFTVSLTLLALGVANMRDRAGALAALAAGVTALLAAGLPYRIGLILGAAAGVTAGILVEQWIRPSSGR